MLCIYHFWFKRSHFCGYVYGARDLSRPRHLRGFTQALAFPAGYINIYTSTGLPVWSAVAVGVGVGVGCGAHTPTPLFTQVPPPATTLKAPCTFSKRTQCYPVSASVPTSSSGASSKPMGVCMHAVPYAS